MSLLWENIARKLGKNKFSFKAISIIQLLATISQLGIFIGIIVYYLFPLDESRSARKVQTGPETPFLIMLNIVIFSFPAVQLVTLATSVVWLVHNFFQEKPILLKVSLIGNVIQVLLGAVTIVVGIFLAISSPATVFFIVISIVMMFLEIWSLLACVCGFAQHKYLKMQADSNYHVEIERQEENIDEEHLNE